MSRRVSPRGVVASAAMLLAAALAGAPAHAASNTVRDTDGSQWTVFEDPADDAQDFVLKHIGPDGMPDPHFGRAGQNTFALSATNDAPNSVRVDSLHRIWMVGASLAGNQPQPVVARFLPDGNLDLRWGVQGKVQLSPNGLNIQPNDLLPLSDGSVLVAGELAGLGAPKAVVFHLKADGALDRAFGNGGIWQHADDGDASTATSLAAGTDGTAAVAVAVRGAKPGAELWSLNDTPPKLIVHKPLDDSSDGADLRTAWVTDHWALNASVGPTGIVPPALLTNRPGTPAAAAVASAPSDPGQGGFNPFEADAASAPQPSADTDDGLPWTWIVIGAVLAAGVIGALVIRGRSAKPVVKAGARR